MTFLKKLGQWIAAGIKLELGLAPLIQAAYPAASGTIAQVGNELTQLASVIVTVESIGALEGLPGDQKVRMAGPLIGQLIQQSSLMAGKEIADGPKFAQACQTIAGGLADLLNSLKAPS